MQEAFTRDRLEAYAARMHPAIEQDSPTWKGGSDFKSYWALKQLTLDIAADIFMGGAEDTSREEMDRVNKAFIACVQAAAGVVRGDVPFTRWGRGYRGRRVLEDFLRHYLPARRATRTDDIFSVLCHIETEDGERFTDDDVVNHMIFLMMAAHDTSTITTSTMLQFLGQHPEWQERCRAESLALGPHPTLKELEGLVSLDLVMKESLRLRAPVPVLMRKTVKDTVVQGVAIPADTDCMVGGAVLPPDGGVLDQPAGLRPRPVLRGPARGQVPPLCLGAVRRRCAQVHRPLLRRRRGEVDHAPAAADWTWSVAAGLRRPARPPLAAVPQGRSAHRLRAEGRVTATLADATRARCDARPARVTPGKLASWTHWVSRPVSHGALPARPIAQGWLAPMSRLG